MKVLIINGPNINLLGIREPEIYGSDTYNDLIDHIKRAAERLQIEPSFYQSNSEGDIVTEIQNAYGCYDGIVINPAAYSHTSIAIVDAIKAIAIPTVEVHLTDIQKREGYRKFSYTTEACIKTICGKGFEGYSLALIALKDHIEG